MSMTNDRHQITHKQPPCHYGKAVFDREGKSLGKKIKLIGQR
jgi:hypothetical protein